MIHEIKVLDDSGESPDCFVTAAFLMTSSRHPGPDVAPFYDVDEAEVFHDRTDCPLGRSIPAARRRIDVANLRGRLSGW